MKRLFCSAMLALALTAYVGAQEKNEPKHEGGGHDDMLGWKLANFVLLGLGLGYLLLKNLPPMFKARTEEIQGGMREAAKMKAEAEATVARIEQKLATVSAEVDGLRTQLKSEMSAEEQRIQQETERLAQRIAHQSEQDIASLTKLARMELKAFSASLALDLAKQRLKGAMNPATQQALVDEFVHDLRGAKPQ